MDKFIKNRTIREQQTQASEQPIEQQQTVDPTCTIISNVYTNFRDMQANIHRQNRKNL
jgi:hypothetical protein